MSVYQTPKSRYWQYDFVFKGRRFHGSTGVETRRAAEKVERRIREDAALGITGDEPTLDQAAGDWWLARGQRRAEAAKLQRRVRIMLRLVGKDLRVTEVTTRIIARAIERRRGETFARSSAEGAKRYPIKNATVNADIVGTARPILNHARKVMQVKGLPEIDWGALTLPEPPELIHYYTADQRAAWLAECDPVARQFLQMLLTYGLRFGEGFFPPRAFDPGLMAPPPDGYGPRLVLQKRKGDPHVLPLREDDAKDVAARVGIAEAAGLETIWFEQAPGRKLVEVTYHGMHSRLRSAGKRAKLDMPRIIHGTRHDAGTSAVRRSKSLKVAQQLLGHKDIQSTMRYAHVLEEDVRATLDAEPRNSPGAAAGDGEFVIAKQRRRRSGA